MLQNVNLGKKQVKMGKEEKISRGRRSVGRSVGGGFFIMAAVLVNINSQHK
jgi:hypothetical protein